MTAQVIDLNSRRPEPEPPCTDCAACQLRALAARLRNHIETHDDALLTDWPAEAAMFTDALATIDAALDQTDRRTPDARR